MRVELVVEDTHILTSSNTANRLDVFASARRDEDANQLVNLDKASMLCCLSIALLANYIDAD